MKPIVSIDDPRLVKALAHPLRIRILAHLEHRTASPSDVAAEIGAPLGNVSYHMRTLERLGLVRMVRTRRRRGAIEHFYSALERPSISAEAWAEVPPVVKKATVDAAIAQVASFVNAAAASGGFDRPDAHLTRTDLRLDGRGWSEVAAVLIDALARVQEIEREALERLEAADDEAQRAGLVMMLFDSAGFATQPHVAPTTPARTRRRV